jgi:hypothetical protein
MSLPASTYTRNADLRHKQSLGRQRKHAVGTPRSQAEAIASVIRKRTLDGMRLPDLDRYNLNDAIWAELLGILDADEITAVADACGSDGHAGAPGLSTCDWNETLAEGAGARESAPGVAAGWRDQNPIYTHSLKWRDSDGTQHLHVIRSDDLDEVLRQVKAIKTVIAAARAHEAEAHEQEPDRPDWCPIHRVQMPERSNAKGKWYSHQATDGTYCKGRTAR